MSCGHAGKIGLRDRVHGLRLGAGRRLAQQEDNGRKRNDKARRADADIAGAPAVGIGDELRNRRRQRSVEP